MNAMLDSRPITVSVRTLDCAHKTRIHYFLPFALDTDLFEAFPDAERKVNQFSRYVEGARDHLTFREVGRYHASGVKGENRLIVTFGKHGDMDVHDLIVDFEEVLISCGAGSIQPLRKAKPMTDEIR